MERIRLSALNRDVEVGDFYNYFYDSLAKDPFFIVNKKNVSVQSTNASAMSFHFIYDTTVPESMYYILGINSHLKKSLDNGFLKPESLWFHTFMTTFSSCPEDIAKLAVYIRFPRRRRTLNDNFIRTNMPQYQMKGFGQATHLVEAVIYGAEVIFLFRKIIDPSHETKDGAVQQLRSLARALVRDVFKSQPTNKDFELSSGVICDVFSNLLPCKSSISHILARHYCNKLASVHSADEEDANYKWRPIDIVLRYIPGQIETRISAERIEDARLEIWELWQTAVNDSRRLANCAIDRFPPLEKSLCQFRDSLTSMCWILQSRCGKIYVEGKDLNVTLNKLRPILDLLNDMITWLERRHQDVELLSSLFEGAQIEMHNMSKIESLLQKSKNKKISEVFVVKIDYEPDQLLIRMAKMIYEETLASSFKLPVFPILSSGRDQESFRRAFREFANRVREHQEEDKIYFIGLVPVFSREYNEGAVYTLKSGGILSVSHQLETQQCVKASLKSTEHPNEANRSPLYSQLFSERKSPLSQQSTPVQSVQRQEVNIQQRPATPFDRKMYDKDLNKSNGSRSQASCSMRFSECSSSSRGIQSFNKDELDPVKSSDSEMDLHPIRARIPADQQESSSNSLDMFMDYDDEPDDTISTSCSGCGAHQSSTVVISDDEESMEEHEMLSQSPAGKSDNVDDADYKENNKSVCEIFASENSNYSELCRAGEPNIFLINAREQLIGNGLRWFETHRFNSAVPHKVIILMGATGCGKSTLINGMVNYILGVRWNDPFRFKIIREDDESATKNQANSQTTSVTAYTLHHKPGMIVPYSITIIDTPGYGDTRGVERDKEITRTIHRFLTEHVNRIDQIHAACFVATSGDSRLTVTQRYIIDSVLSIFGKDFKDNIRLLVTFADNADPPVVEACLAANFPVSNPDGRIQYSKFNSSVLYASNQQSSSEDDFCFDELFWDMGKENFEKFFTMLEGMKGRSLESTREVIQRRHLLEESLKAIEDELEVCFVNIENMEKFQKKIKEHRNSMDTNKNFVVETKTLRLVEVKCDDKFVAYNCQKCKVTCERRVKTFKKRPCQNSSCRCLAGEHKFQEFEWTRFYVTEKKTLMDMKKEYEENCKAKLSTEQFLLKCKEELRMARVKVLSLLDQVSINSRSLDATALRSNALTPTEYLCLMKSKVAEQQAPGYMVRLETLTELQRSLAAEASNEAKKINCSPPQSREYKQTASESRCRGRGTALATNASIGVGKTTCDSTKPFEHKETVSGSRGQGFGMSLGSPSVSPYVSSASAKLQQPSVGQSMSRNVATNDRVNDKDDKKVSEPVGRSNAGVKDLESKSSVNGKETFVDTSGQRSTFEKPPEKTEDSADGANFVLSTKQEQAKQDVKTDKAEGRVAQILKGWYNYASSKF